MKSSTLRSALVLLGALELLAPLGCEVAEDDVAAPSPWDGTGALSGASSSVGGASTAWRLDDRETDFALRVPVSLDFCWE